MYITIITAISFTAVHFFLVPYVEQRNVADREAIELIRIEQQQQSAHVYY